MHLAPLAVEHGVMMMILGWHLVFSAVKPPAVDFLFPRLFSFDFVYLDPRSGAGIGGAGSFLRRAMKVSGATRGAGDR